MSTQENRVKLVVYRKESETETIKEDVEATDWGDITIVAFNAALLDQEAQLQLRDVLQTQVVDKNKKYILIPRGLDITFYGVKEYVTEGPTDGTEDDSGSRKQKCQCTNCGCGKA